MIWLTALMIATVVVAFLWEQVAHFIFTPFSTPYQLVKKVYGVRVWSRISSGDITSDDQDAAEYKLENANPFAIEISFDYYCEASDGKLSITCGPCLVMESGEVKEGTRDNLWTVPFSEGISVRRAGFKNMRIRRRLTLCA